MLQAKKTKKKNQGFGILDVFFLIMGGCSEKVKQQKNQLLPTFSFHNLTSRLKKVFAKCLPKLNRKLGKFLE